MTNTNTAAVAQHFRAIWPIVDMSVPMATLLEEAAADLDAVATRARAELTGPGRWSMAPSASVPGSGRVTENVLVYDGPARSVARDYHAPLAVAS